MVKDALMPNENKHLKSTPKIVIPDDIPSDKHRVYRAWRLCKDHGYTLQEARLAV